MYVNGYLKNKILPDNISKLRTWMMLADASDPTARDVRPLMSLLKRLPQADRYLFGLFQTRKLAILGFDYVIDFPKDSTPTEAELKRLQEIQRRFRIAKARKLSEVIVNGRLFGQSAVELAFRNVPGIGTYPVKMTPYDLTEIDIDEKGEAVWLSTDTQSQQVFRSRFQPTETHIVTMYNPFAGIDNRFIGGLARINMIYVLLKYWEAWNWAKNNEKYGDPLIYAQYGRGTSEEEKTNLLTGLANLGTDSYAAFSEDVQVKLLEAMRKTSADAHQAFIDQVNKEMAISVLGQQLTTDVGKVGSFAAAKIANFVREDYLYADLLEVQEQMNGYLLQDWELNYGEAAALMPEFRFLIDEQADYESNARIISEMKISGVPLKKSEVYEKIGFSMPDDDDEVLFTAAQPNPLDTMEE
jgi:phage gp29-like protein